MRRLLRSQSGSALVSAIAVTSVMIMLGLATFAMVDAQQSQSGRERISESSFNLSEAALNLQAFVLSRDWPGTAVGAYPTSCSESTGARGCPDPARIVSSFDSVDVKGNAEWTTMVRDDGGSNPNFYDDATVSAQPSWDANQNNRLWVRAQSLLRGKRRTLVALVKVEMINEQAPMNVVTAGHFATNNNGDKTIVDTNGRPLAVRCRSLGNPKCLDFRSGQVLPPGAVQEGYEGPTALTPAAIDRLRTRARAEGTYHASGCPSDPSGAVVFIESGDCQYTSGSANSPASPGVLVIMRGTLSLGGNFEYYGLVYMGNLQNSSGYLITMQGTSLIQGAVAVDGDGGIEAGSSKENIIFDSRPFSNLRSYGTAGIMHNSWREISG
jgi:hypothetical protein